MHESEGESENLSERESETETERVSRGEPRRAGHTFVKI